MRVMMYRSVLSLVCFVTALSACQVSVHAALILTPGDTILSIDLEGQSETPGGEPASNAIDGLSSTKYLNRGGSPEPPGTNFGVNTGFIVTPTVGTGAGEFGTIVTSFEITTANDAEARDPSAWELFGTNNAIMSLNESDGNGGETWTSIDLGTLSLPGARLTAGGDVAVSNTTAYTSYRMVFTDLKGGALVRMQIAEIQFEGTVAAIPEPSSIVMFGLGSLLMLRRRLR